MIICFLGLVLQTGSFGAAQQQQQHDSDACRFTGEPSHATVAGPADISPLVYVVEQPDSPIEIVSVGLQGMWLFDPANNIQSGTVDSIESGIDPPGSSSGLLLSSWLAAPVAQGVRGS